MIAVQRAPGENEVVISRHELDSLIDAMNRASASLGMMDEFLIGASTKVKAEKKVIDQCIFSLGRYQRCCAPA